MKNSRILTYIIVFVASLMWSCKSEQTLQQGSIKPIPNSFNNSNDSASSANIRWKEYFSDTNLLTLLDTAVGNNLDGLIALQRIEIAKAGVQYSKGALLPTINGIAVPKINRYGLYTMDGAGNSTTDIQRGRIIPTNLPDYLVGFQTIWEADIWGKLRNRKKAAIARYMASAEGRNWMMTNVVAQVANSYYELLALDYELEIIEETISLQQNAFEIVTVQKEAGAANELAVKQFKAQLLNSKALEIQVKQQIIESESRINILLGRFPQPIIRDKTSFAQSNLSEMQTGIPSDLLRNRPDIRQSELELVAAKADVKSAKAMFYPTFHLTGGVGFQAFEPSLLFTTPQSFIFSLLGSISAPLINRSAIKAEFKAANAFQVEALYNYQKSILNGYVEVYNELQNIKNLQQIYEIRNEEVTTLSQAIETSFDLFRTGRATYLEVLLTQQNALNAKLDFTNTRKNQYISRVNLYKALGGGWY